MDQELFRLSKAELRALLAFVSKDDLRPNLSSILFDPVKGWVAATDGHVLVTREGPPPPGGHAMFLLGGMEMACVHRALLGGWQACILAAPKDSEVPVLLLDRQFNTRARMLLRKVDAKFPDIGSVLFEPSEDRQPALMASYNAQFLAKLPIVQSAAGALGVRMYAPMSEFDPLLYIVDERGWGEEKTRWRVLVMPLRV